MSIPITVEMLRDDWVDHPDLMRNPELRAALEALPDDRLQEALNEAFDAYEDMWWHILDSAREDATTALTRGLEAAA